MLDMGGGDRDVQIDPGYALGQFARAFETAQDHEDPATRERADRRMAQWSAVLRGMASGRLTIGSRTPVDDLPAWVTPEVVRGGFATAAAAAEGPLQAQELQVMRRADLPRTRRALFDYLLSTAGLEDLSARLTSRRFDVRVPEEAALLTLVWLVRQGDHEAALGLAKELSPFAHRLRFLPTPVGGDVEPSIVFRETVGTARATLDRRREHARIATMRETLTVWNPFADELLSLWLETRAGSEVGAVRPANWEQRATALLERYEELAARYLRATKHRRPKENLNILLRATRAAVAGDALDDLLRRRLRRAVDDMLAKRGAPGSAAHAALRHEQATVAALPTHHALAKLAVARLAALPQDRGVPSTAALLEPVSQEETAGSGVPAGTEMPPSITRTVARTLEGTPEHLIAQGVVGSAEVLAELVPRIAAATVAAAYPDAELQAVIAANYAAFRRRRSLLLLDLEHQVRVEELPWVHAVESYRTAGEETVASSRAALGRLTELTLTAFPATIVPSPLVTELQTLAGEGGLDLPLLEELAADIFMGTFTSKFVRAAHCADELLRGSLYQRYYDIDHTAIPSATADFAALCRARADASGDDRWSVASNGTVIEQAQILTTHNLAVLTGPFGIGELLDLDWRGLAERCLSTVFVLARRLRRNPRPLRTIKDTAYAWRQMVFFLSRLSQAEQRAFAGAAHRALDEQAPDARRRVSPAVRGLAHVVDGGRFDEAGRPDEGRRLLGWTTKRHWMLDGA
jgi:hypothetical protein